MNVRKRVFGFLYFAVTIAILIGLLKVTNWLPTVFQEGIIKKYSSIEEVKSRLQLRDVYIPSYFPQKFKWPPSRILAQSKPFIAVVMEFRNMETGETDLIISHAASKDFTPDKKIVISQIKERVNYSLNGRPSILEVGVCKNDVPCSRISWEEGSTGIRVEMKSAPFELIKIAESMIH
jgi:hypothetical protein